MSSTVEFITHGGTPNKLKQLQREKENKHPKNDDQYPNLMFAKETPPRRMLLVTTKNIVAKNHEAITSKNLNSSSFKNQTIFLERMHKLISH